MDQYEDYGDCPLASVWWEDYEDDISDVSDFEWDIPYQESEDE